MKYFLHDSNAFSDEKITELYINYGYEGIGLFFTLLEKMACQEKPIKTIVLKQQLNVGKKLEKCWKFMESLDLISSNNGETFNKQLLKFSEKYQIKKEKNKERIANWRSNSEKEENVTCYKSVRNTRKDKINKVKESKSIKNTGADAPIPKERREDIDILLNGIQEVVKVLDGSKLEQRSFAKNFLDSKTPEILRQTGNLSPTKQQIINATIRIFQLASKDNFHQKWCTSMKYVYNKAGAIIATAKSNNSQVIKIS
jgi:hypothetical protein